MMSGSGGYLREIATDSDIESKECGVDKQQPAEPMESHTVSMVQRLEMKMNAGRRYGQAYAIA